MKEILVVVFLLTYRNHSILDTFEHDILLSKLEYYGVRGLANEWFKSQLSSKKQHVSINGSDSNHADLKLGVSRGSILAQLFLIYINDLNQALELFDLNQA